MRIVVNDIAASTTGALSILKDFYHYIAEHDKEHEWIFLLGDAYIEETERIQVKVLSEVKKSWSERLKFDFLTGAAYIRALNPDVVFSMQNTLTRGYHGKQVVYVHQPLGFQKTKKFSFLKSEEREYAVYQYIIGAMIDSAVRHADKTIVQTEWMRQAVIEKTKVSPEKVVKILPDIKFDFPESIEEKKMLQMNRFFFPSGDILYKNHQCILEAAELLRKENITDFEIAFTLTEQEAADSLKCKDSAVKQNISYRGRMTREEVYRLYYERILIFPSYIETFGYPPAEARQAGDIIFASDCPFCHEVLEGYADAYYFNPFKPEELAALMKRAMNGEIKKKAIEKAVDIQKQQDITSWKQVLETVASAAAKSER